MSDQFFTLPLASLSPDPHQPRRELENDSNTVTEAATLQGLANSIAEVGILQPIRVRAVADVAGAPHYQIISGQRRFEAARMLGLGVVPCLVIDEPANASHTLVAQVTENLQRKAMTPSELAVAVQTLVAAGATQDEVARKLGIQSSQVTLLLNLLVLAGPVKVAFERGRIESPRAAYDLNKLPPALQEQLIGEAENKGRVVTQRDVREVKQLHAKQLSQVRHRYEAPEVTADEYQAFAQCLDDGVEDNYDPMNDRDAVFGEDWTQIEARQSRSPAGGSGTPTGANADNVDALRVRVPGFTLGRDQVFRLYQLLGAIPPDLLAEASPPGLVGKELARRLSEL
jgi:ParB/RepB/Spo0J family partition protein